MNEQKQNTPLYIFISFLGLIRYIFSTLTKLTLAILKRLFVRPTRACRALVIFSFFFILFTCLNQQSKPSAVNIVHADLTQAKENIIDTKPTSWRRLNSNGLSQRYIEGLTGGRELRIMDILQAYGFNPNTTRPALQTIARIHKVYPEVILCIAYADSSLGTNLKTKHNYGNVGNNDRGDTQAFDNLEQGFNAIGQTLNNRYLGDYNTIDQLSRAHNKTGMVYATSKENRNINVLNCLGMIRNKKVPDNFAFRW